MQKESLPRFHRRLGAARVPHRGALRGLPGQVRSDVRLLRTEHGQRHTQLSHGTQTAPKVNTASERDSGRPQENTDYSGHPQITSEKDSEHSEKKRDYLVITFKSTECTENRSPDDSTGIKLQKILFRLY